MYTNWKNNKEKLQQAVSKSYSVAETLRHLGLKEAGGNFHTVRLWIKKHGIDCSHFVGQSWNKNNFKNLDSLRCLTAIKDNLIRNRGIQCESCKRKQWLGKPIAIEMHHVDGDRTNNSLENLQLLCPNCHAYTDNWRGKNKKQTNRDIV